MRKGHSGRNSVTRITHILAATDLTGRAERAVERALQLQRETDATLTLVHVVEPGLLDNLEARRCADAEAFLHKRVSCLPEPARSRCACKVLIGDAFSTIAREALTLAAGLIVLGEPGKYRYCDLFVGTTAERVVRASPVPVLVVKRESLGPYGRVLVPFDLSEGATRALKTALSIAPAAEFRVVHAWRPPLATFSEPRTTRAAITKENAEIMALIERVTHETIARSGMRETAFAVDMIEENPYLVLRNESGWPDLMAMGTHARGRLATGMIGNLARHMLAEAPCDVLVARP